MSESCENMLRIYFTLFLAILSTTTETTIGSKVKICPCANNKDCHYNYRSLVVPKPAQEVYVLTNGSSNYKEWDMNTLTTIVSTQNQDNKDIMCYAHSLDRKYGIIIDVPEFDDVNNTQVHTWIEDFKNKRSKSMADVIILNLMPFVMKSTKENFIKVLDLLQILKKFLYQTQKIDCIVPWKPVLYEEMGEVSFTSKLGTTCDKFLFSPESYLHIEGYGCRARATIPMTKLALGVDEYVSEGISEDRLILSVPWHGYSYPCKSYNKTTKICKMEMINNTCDVARREQMTIGEVFTKPYINLLHTEMWNVAYKAPFHVFMENTSKGEIYHQLWYEDVESLRVKYTYVKDMELAGLAVWTGDDLISSAQPIKKSDFNMAMWSWILHDMLNKGHIQPRGVPKYYYASTVTGVAIGCLFGGLLLGVIFTCIGFRKIEKKKLPPFRKDLVQDDYHDDDIDL